MKYAKVIAVVLTCGVFLSVCALPARAQNAPLLYENKITGLSIRGPQGWTMTAGDKLQAMISKSLYDVTQDDKMSQKIGVLVLFTKYPLFRSPGASNPSISLVGELVNLSTFKSIAGYANDYLATLKAALMEVKVLKRPRSVKINGIEGVNFMYEGTMDSGKGPLTLRYLVYLLFKDNICYTISCSDRPEYFKNGLKAFESCAKTFTLR